ncbi:hotdog fold thioesterase [candidate division KSB1 bacterium]|nr:PaaI family thioesterase [candidate division KSB1 bacterium]NIU90409.1 hotdog fold thioesterase [candidate division KSB1 bacterium]NIW18630.1 hotdog fold thioesterase [candidate division KSB1 bacterium]NIW69171.1 hotdog fold thioesterase [candidate division KSB1 bacterium]
MKSLPRYNDCFVCGKKNPIGLDVAWYVDTDRQTIKSEFVATKEHAGYRGVLHGGVISSIMDEGMGWACSYYANKMCVTGDLRLRFLRPALVGTNLLFIGKLIHDSGRYFEARGRLQDDAGRLYTVGQGKYYPISEEISKSLGAFFNYQDCRSRDYENCIYGALQDEYKN